MWRRYRMISEHLRCAFVMRSTQEWLVKWALPTHSLSSGFLLSPLVYWQCHLISDLSLCRVTTKRTLICSSLSSSFSGDTEIRGSFPLSFAMCPLLFVVRRFFLFPRPMFRQSVRWLERSFVLLLYLCCSIALLPSISSFGIRWRPVWFEVLTGKCDWPLSVFATILWMIGLSTISSNRMTNPPGMRTEKVKTNFFNSSFAALSPVWSLGFVDSKRCIEWSFSSVCSASGCLWSRKLPHGRSARSSLWSMHRTAHVRGEDSDVPICLSCSWQKERLCWLTILGSTTATSRWWIGWRWSVVSAPWYSVFRGMCVSWIRSIVVYWSLWYSLQSSINWARDWSLDRWKSSPIRDSNRCSSFRSLAFSSVCFVRSLSVSSMSRTLVLI